MTDKPVYTPMSDEDVARFKEALQEMGRFASIGFKPGLEMIARIEAEVALRKELMAKVPEVSKLEQKFWC